MTEQQSDHCLLDHPAFTAFGPPVFRWAETDRTPVMVVSLGEREAAVPLRALQREFQIEDDSDDGRMLGLIAEALDYVPQLALGDALPGEVLDGSASWKPDPKHLQIAAARLRAQLVAWLQPGHQLRHDGAPPCGELWLRLDTDPKSRVLVQKAFVRAAAELGLAGPEQVVTRLEGLAEELSYIEALRDRYGDRVQALVRRVGGLAQNRSADAARQETITQVERMAAIGLRGIVERLEEVDAQTEEVLSALRNADSQRSFIRSNRDFLYRGLRAWEPILAEWDQAGSMSDESLWQLVGRTYHFLAQRHMPSTEWPGLHMPRRKPGAPAGMVW
jgi:hypothetical protein